MSDPNEMTPAAVDTERTPDENLTISGNARITTLSLVDEAKLTKRVPSYNPEKGMSNHKSFMRYVRSAYKGATAETLIEQGVGEIADVELGDIWVRYVDTNIGFGALHDGTVAVLSPSEDTSKARYLLVDLMNRLTPAKSSVQVSRRNPTDSVEFGNAIDLLAMRTIREDFKSHARAAGNEASVLGDQAIDDFFMKILGDSRMFTPSRIRRAFPLSYDLFDIITPTRRQVIAEALGIDPEKVISEPGKSTEVKLSDVLEEASPDQLKNVLAELKYGIPSDGGASIDEHYVKSMERAMISRSYSNFMQQTMDRMVDVQQQRRYEKSISDRDSATVYQQKKNVPDTHLEAAAESVFIGSGDFSHVEIDESVDLDLMASIEAEWEILRDALPHSENKAALRFRKTGRHKAAGVYHPIKHNIAVDPRHPHSFVHEYFHHLDYTLGADKDTKQLSLSKDFVEILHGVQQRMRTNPKIDKLDYYTTPTEVFARGGELVCYWSGLATSLNGDKEHYDQPVYQVFEPYREQLIDWYSKHLGLNIDHELRVNMPDDLERPSLKPLSDASNMPKRSPRVVTKSDSVDTPGIE